MQTRYQAGYIFIDGKEKPHVPGVPKKGVLKLFRKKMK